MSARSASPFFTPPCSSNWTISSAKSRLEVSCAAFTNALGFTCKESIVAPHFPFSKGTQLTRNPLYKAILKKKLCEGVILCSSAHFRLFSKTDFETSFFCYAQGIFLWRENRFSKRKKIPLCRLGVFLHLMQEFEEIENFPYYCVPYNLLFLQKQGKRKKCLPCTGLEKNKKKRKKKGKKLPFFMVMRPNACDRFSCLPCAGNVI